MEKIVKVKGEKLKIEVIDKKLKNTLVCIHGFASDKNFIGDLGKYLDNFNIISISYGNVSKLEIDYIADIIQTFFEIHLGKTRIYVLGHSLGGLFASQVSTMKKVKGVYLLNPVHPLLWGAHPFNKLQKVVEAKSKITKSTIALVIKILKSTNSGIVKFVDPESPWFNVTINLVRNGEKIKSILIKAHEQIKDKAIFLVSKVDNIVSATNLLTYLRKNKFKHHEMDYEGHSPLVNDSKFVAKYFSNIKRKRRLAFWRKIV